MIHLPPEFIHLHDNKVPYSFDIDDGTTADSGLDGAGVLIHPPYLVLDFDNQWSATKIQLILKQYGIKTPMMKSDRGVHIGFQTDQQFTSGTNLHLPILLQCDVKAGGFNRNQSEKKVYTMVKRYGKGREGINETTEVAPLPYGLIPRNKPYSPFNLNSSFDIGDRNSNLFKLTGHLKNHLYNFNQDQIKVIIETINNYLLQAPLPQNEIDSITREQPETLTSIPSFRDKKNHFIHEKMARYLIQKYQIKRYKNSLGIWDNKNNRYYLGEKKLLQDMTYLEYNLSTNQRKEVLKFMFDSLDEIYSPNYYYEGIGFQNGLLNTSTFVFSPPDPNLFTPYYLNTTYTHDFDIPTAEGIQDLILDILSDRLEQYKTLFQIIGYCMMPHINAQQAFIFYGTGANGKSLIAEDLIRHLFEPYTAATSMEALKETFGFATLEHALVNIDSDNSDKYLTQTGAFKKLVTGDRIEINKKNVPQYESRLSVKLIYSFNKLPRTSDISKGFNRRLLFLEFAKVYEDETADKTLSYQIQKNGNEIAKFIVYESVEHLKELEKQGWKFDQINQHLLQEVEESSDPVKAGISENQITETYFLDSLHYVSYFHQFDFQAWCKDNNYKSEYTQKVFTRRIKDIFPKLTTIKSGNSITKKPDRKFIRKEEI